MPCPSRQRVLLLDDDPTIRLFVGLALEDLSVEVVGCDTVDQALAELRSAPCALILCDLVLREGSGYDLLRALQQTPALLGAGRVAVFSSAVDVAARDRLRSLGVWHTLPKPTSLDSLQACAREALACGAAPAATCPQADSAGIEAAVQAHFGGDRTLFDAFQAACWAQFPHDVRCADAALAQRDAAELKRLGHTLKTVLAMLGKPALAREAATLDEVADAADWPRIEAAWTALRHGLHRP